MLLPEKVFDKIKKAKNIFVSVPNHIFLYEVFAAIEERCENTNINLDICSFMKFDESGEELSNKATLMGIVGIPAFEMPSYIHGQIVSKKAAQKIDESKFEAPWLMMSVHFVTLDGIVMEVLTSDSFPKSYSSLTDSSWARPLVYSENMKEIEVYDEIGKKLKKVRPRVIDNNYIKNKHENLEFIL